MLSFPRPSSRASFIRVAFALAGLGCLACSTPSEETGDKQPAKGAGKAGDKQPAGDKQAKGPDKADKADKSGATAPAQDDCCRYCFEGEPCGDRCVPAGESCDAQAGCACSKDKRPVGTFRKGWMPPKGSGLLGPDVFAYNKAQGDPTEGAFTLEMAFADAPELADASKGTLTAVFETSMGSFECELFEEKAPLTVANFVGLARGVRPFKDPANRRSEEWKRERYYDGTVFHRVIDGFMIQGGDPTSMGTGTPGYVIPDEFHPDLRHSGPGILSMANRNPFDRATQGPVIDEKTGLTVGNTGSAQFFVTVTKTSQLDNRHTVFGKCDTKVPVEISKVRTQSRPVPDKPFEDVTIKKLEIVRK